VKRRHTAQNRLAAKINVVVLQFLRNYGFRPNAVLKALINQVESCHRACSASRNPSSQTQEPKRSERDDSKIGLTLWLGRVGSGRPWYTDASSGLSLTIKHLRMKIQPQIEVIRECSHQQTLNDAARQARHEIIDSFPWVPLGNPLYLQHSYTQIWLSVLGSSIFQQ